MYTIRCRITPRLLSWSCATFLLVLLLSPLTASAVNLTGLSLAPPNPTLNITETLQLIATGSYDDGTQLVIANAKQVSTGNAHACALSTDGTVRCWGRNNYGQLGNGTITNSSKPITVTGLSTVVSISLGGDKSCALLTDGTVRCWGRNLYGELGVGTTIKDWAPVPLVVNGLSNAVAISAGRDHACALIADGTVRCWGSNGVGELGNGTINSSYTPVAVSGISSATAVSAGYAHSCAILVEGSVRCWGANGAGQLGNGTTTLSLIPVAVVGLGTATKISAGNVHTCAVLAEGKVLCWGDSRYGLLGNGTISYGSTANPFPLPVLDVSTAVAVSAGDKHSCAVLADDTVRCWGSGRLGDGTATPSATPVDVSGINRAVGVSAGGGEIDPGYTCAVLTDGTVRCWGSNNVGQLGNGTTTASPIPVTVSGISTAVAVSSGEWSTCSPMIDGTLRCWGKNDWGQLGNGTTTDSSTPVVVNGINTAVAVSVGYGHNCAVLIDGTVRCWGADSLVPVIVTGINTAVAVSVGYGHNCAVLIDGTVRCWGKNDWGQLGNGTTTDSSTPVVVNGINSAVAVEVGFYTSCAVLADGKIQCWGRNLFGLLGDGSSAALSMTPVSVSSINTAVAVSVSDDHACAVLADGVVRCWGYNTSGQLGDGTAASSSTPVAVSSLSTAVEVSAGGIHSCALLADGTVRCWGGNNVGQLGNPIANGTYMRTVVGLDTATKISAGGEHTCAVLSDGSIRCWGNNFDGQLGNGTASYFLTPTPTLNYFPVAWTSSNPVAASVNGTGQVKAATAGTTQITASLSGLSASTIVTVAIGNPPVASDVNATAVTGASIGWTPIVSDLDGDPLSCRLGTPPTNGTATVSSNCASGTYQSNPGFIGTDSFTYIANDGQNDSNPGTVTVAVFERSADQICVQNNPVSQFTQTGKDGTLTISFTGNITAHTNKAVKVCPGTTLKYQTSSTKGSVVCQVKNNTTRGSGNLKINDHIKCTDKPAGKDKVHFKVKSGVSK
jgi:alpha-tubulin suppressor-like RCC1 family protein